MGGQAFRFVQMDAVEGTILFTGGSGVTLGGQMKSGSLEFRAGTHPSETFHNQQSMFTVELREVISSQSEGCGQAEKNKTAFVTICSAVEFVMHTIGSADGTPWTSFGGFIALYDNKGRLDTKKFGGVTISGTDEETATLTRLNFEPAMLLPSGGIVFYAYTDEGKTMSEAVPVNGYCWGSQAPTSLEGVECKLVIGDIGNNDLFTIEVADPELGGAATSGDALSGHLTATVLEAPTSTLLNELLFGPESPHDLGCYDFTQESINTTLPWNYENACALMEFVTNETSATNLTVYSIDPSNNTHLVYENQTPTTLSLTDGESVTRLLVNATGGAAIPSVGAARLILGDVTEVICWGVEGSIIIPAHGGETDQLCYDLQVTSITEKRLENVVCDLSAVQTFNEVSISEASPGRGKRTCSSDSYPDMPNHSTRFNDSKVWINEICQSGQYAEVIALSDGARYYMRMFDIEGTMLWMTTKQTPETTHPVPTVIPFGLTAQQNIPNTGCMSLHTCEDEQCADQGDPMFAVCWASGEDYFWLNHNVQETPARDHDWVWGDQIDTSLGLYKGQGSVYGTQLVSGGWNSTSSIECSKSSANLDQVIVFSFLTEIISSNTIDCTEVIEEGIVPLLPCGGVEFTYRTLSGEMIERPVMVSKATVYAYNGAEFEENFTFTFGVFEPTEAVDETHNHVWKTHPDFTLYTFPAKGAVKLQSEEANASRETSDILCWGEGIPSTDVGGEDCFQVLDDIDFGIGALVFDVDVNEWFNTTTEQSTPQIDNRYRVASPGGVTHITELIVGLNETNCIDWSKVSWAIWHDFNKLCSHFEVRVPVADVPPLSASLIMVWNESMTIETEVDLSNSAFDESGELFIASILHDIPERGALKVVIDENTTEAICWGGEAQMLIAGANPIMCYNIYPSELGDIITERATINKDCEEPFEWDVENITFATPAQPNRECGEFPTQSPDYPDQFSHFLDSRVWVNELCVTSMLGYIEILAPADGLVYNVELWAGDIVVENETVTSDNSTRKGETVVLSVEGTTWVPSLEGCVRVTRCEDDSTCVEVVFAVCWANDWGEYNIKLQAKNFGEHNLLYEDPDTNVPIHFELTRGVSAKYGGQGVSGIWEVDVNGDCSKYELNKDQVIITSRLQEVISSDVGDCLSIVDYKDFDWVPLYPCGGVELDLMMHTGIMSERKTFDQNELRVYSIGDNNETTVLGSGELPELVTSTAGSVTNTTIPNCFIEVTTINQFPLKGAIGVWIHNEFPVRSGDEYVNQLMICWGVSDPIEIEGVDCEIISNNTLSANGTLELQEEETWVMHEGAYRASPSFPNNMGPPGLTYLNEIIFGDESDSCVDFTVVSWERHHDFEETCSHIELYYIDYQAPVITRARMWLINSLQPDLPRLEDMIELSFSNILTVPNYVLAHANEELYRYPGVIEILTEDGNIDMFCYGIDKRLLIDGVLCNNMGTTSGRNGSTEPKCENNEGPEGSWVDNYLAECSPGRPNRACSDWTEPPPMTKPDMFDYFLDSRVWLNEISFDSSSQLEYMEIVVPNEDAYFAVEYRQLGPTGTILNYTQKVDKDETLNDNDIQLILIEYDDLNASMLNNIGCVKIMDCGDDSICKETDVIDRWTGCWTNDWEELDERENVEANNTLGWFNLIIDGIWDTSRRGLILTGGPGGVYGSFDNWKQVGNFSSTEGLSPGALNPDQVYAHVQLQEVISSSRKATGVADGCILAAEHSGSNWVPQSPCGAVELDIVVCHGNLTANVTVEGGVHVYRQGTMYAGLDEDYVIPFQVTIPANNSGRINYNNQVYSHQTPQSDAVLMSPIGGVAAMLHTGKGVEERVFTWCWGVEAPVDINGTDCEIATSSEFFEFGSLELIDDFVNSTRPNTGTYPFLMHDGLQMSTPTLPNKMRPLGLRHLSEVIFGWNSSYCTDFTKVSWEVWQNYSMSCFHLESTAEIEPRRWAGTMSKLIETGSNLEVEETVELGIFSSAYTFVDNRLLVKLDEPLYQQAALLTYDVDNIVDHLCYGIDKRIILEDVLCNNFDSFRDLDFDRRSSEPGCNATELEWETLDAADSSPGRPHRICEPTGWEVPEPVIIPEAFLYYNDSKVWINEICDDGGEGLEGYIEIAVPNVGAYYRLVHWSNGNYSQTQQEVLLAEPDGLLSSEAAILLTIEGDKWAPTSEGCYNIFHCGDTESCPINNNSTPLYTGCYTWNWEELAFRGNDEFNSVKLGDFNLLYDSWWPESGNNSLKLTGGIGFEYVHFSYGGEFKMDSQCTRNEWNPEQIYQNYRLTEVIASDITSEPDCIDVVSGSNFAPFKPCGGFEYESYTRHGNLSGSPPLTGHRVSLFNLTEDLDTPLITEELETIEKDANQPHLVWHGGGDTMMKGMVSSGALLFEVWVGEENPSSYRHKSPIYAQAQLYCWGSEAAADVQIEGINCTVLSTNDLEKDGSMDVDHSIEPQEDDVWVVYNSHHDATTPALNNTWKSVPNQFLNEVIFGALDQISPHSDIDSEPIWQHCTDFVTGEIDEMTWKNYSSACPHVEADINNATQEDLNPELRLFIIDDSHVTTEFIVNLTEANRTNTYGDYFLVQLKDHNETPLTPSAGGVHLKYDTADDRLCWGIEGKVVLNERLCSGGDRGLFPKLHTSLQYSCDGDDTWKVVENKYCSPGRPNRECDPDQEFPPHPNQPNHFSYWNDSKVWVNEICYDGNADNSSYFEVVVPGQIDDLYRVSLYKLSTTAIETHFTLEREEMLGSPGDNAGQVELLELDEGWDLTEEGCLLIYKRSASHGDKKGEEFEQVYGVCWLEDWDSADWRIQATDPERGVKYNLIQNSPFQFAPNGQWEWSLNEGVGVRYGSHGQAGEWQFSEREESNSTSLCSRGDFNLDQFYLSYRMKEIISSDDQHGAEDPQLCTHVDPDILMAPTNPCGGIEYDVYYRGGKATEEVSFDTQHLQVYSYDLQTNSSESFGDIIYLPVQTFSGDRRKGKDVTNWIDFTNSTLPEVGCIVGRTPTSTLVSPLFEDLWIRCWGPFTQDVEIGDSTCFVQASNSSKGYDRDYPCHISNEHLMAASFIEVEDDGTIHSREIEDWVKYQTLEFSSPLFRNSLKNQPIEHLNEVTFGVDDKYCIDWTVIRHDVWHNKTRSCTHIESIVTGLNDTTKATEYYPINTTSFTLGDKVDLTYLNERLNTQTWPPIAESPSTGDNTYLIWLVRLENNALGRQGGAIKSTYEKVDRLCWGIEGKVLVDGQLCNNIFTFYGNGEAKEAMAVGKHCNSVNDKLGSSRWNYGEASEVASPGFVDVTCGYSDYPSPKDRPTHFSAYRESRIWMNEMCGASGSGYLEVVSPSEGHYHKIEHWRTQIYPNRGMNVTTFYTPYTDRISSNLIEVSSILNNVAYDPLNQGEGCVRIFTCHHNDEPSDRALEPLMCINQSHKAVYAACWSTNWEDLNARIQDESFGPHNLLKEDQEKAFDEAGCLAIEGSTSVKYGHQDVKGQWVHNAFSPSRDSLNKDQVYINIDFEEIISTAQIPACSWVTSGTGHVPSRPCGGMEFALHQMAGQPSADRIASHGHYIQVYEAVNGVVTSTSTVDSTDPSSTFDGEDSTGDVDMYGIDEYTTRDDEASTSTNYLDDWSLYKYGERNSFGRLITEVPVSMTTMHAWVSASHSEFPPSGAMAVYIKNGEVLVTPGPADEGDLETTPDPDGQDKVYEEIFELAYTVCWGVPEALDVDGVMCDVMTNELMWPDGSFERLGIDVPVDSLPSPVKEWKRYEGLYQTTPNLPRSHRQIPLEHLNEMVFGKASEENCTDFTLVDSNTWQNYTASCTHIESLLKWVEKLPKQTPISSLDLFTVTPAELYTVTRNESKVYRAHPKYFNETDEVYFYGRMEGTFPPVGGLIWEVDGHVDVFCWGFDGRVVLESTDGSTKRLCTSAGVLPTTGMPPSALNRNCYWGKNNFEWIVVPLAMCSPGRPNRQCYLGEWPTHPEQPGPFTHYTDSRVFINEICSDDDDGYLEIIAPNDGEIYRIEKWESPDNSTNRYEYIISSESQRGDFTVHELNGPDWKPTDEGCIRISRCVDQDSCRFQETAYAACWTANWETLDWRYQTAGFGDYNLVSEEFFSQKAVLSLNKGTSAKYGGQSGSGSWVFTEGPKASCTRGELNPGQVLVSIQLSEIISSASGADVKPCESVVPGADYIPYKPCGGIEMDIFYRAGNPADDETSIVGDGHFIRVFSIEGDDNVAVPHGDDVVIGPYTTTEAWKITEWNQYKETSEPQMPSKGAVVFFVKIGKNMTDSDDSGEAELYEQQTSVCWGVDKAVEIQGEFCEVVTTKEMASDGVFDLSIDISPWASKHDDMKRILKHSFIESVNAKDGVLTGLDLEKLRNTDGSPEHLPVWTTDAVDFSSSSSSGEDDSTSTTMDNDDIYPRYSQNWDTWTGHDSATPGFRNNIKSQSIDHLNEIVFGGLVSTSCTDFTTVNLAEWQDHSNACTHIESKINSEYSTPTIRVFEVDPADSFKVTGGDVDVNIVNSRVTEDGTIYLSHIDQQLPIVGGVMVNYGSFDRLCWGFDAKVMFNGAFCHNIRITPIQPSTIQKECDSESWTAGTLSDSTPGLPNPGCEGSGKPTNTPPDTTPSEEDSSNFPTGAVIGASAAGLILIPAGLLLLPGVGKYEDAEEEDDGLEEEEDWDDDGNTGGQPLPVDTQINVAEGRFWEDAEGDD
eukprot:GHVN01001259.1.p1 GENE.GHVN01001259.1~~GHVN01001259.1.p1  ORF type:complete len:4694 (+),score=811.65 GHVN01001259.1:570-14651(+)